MNSDWSPPKQHGLQNSRQIIHPWFINNVILRGEPINYLEILKDDIRNFRPLDKIQLDYLKKLEKEDLLDIIQIYNAVTQSLLQ